MKFTNAPKSTMLDDFAGIDLADFRFRHGDVADHVIGFFRWLRLVAAILIVPSSSMSTLGAGGFADFADDLAARADDFADLVFRDLDGRCAGAFWLTPSRGLRSGLAISPRMCKRPSDAPAERDFHDLFGDRGDLDVHLQGGDAVVWFRPP
jgi:hypothetical protein